MESNSKITLKKVLLVGRPNVGKSSLFNTLTRSREAVVKNQPGVTRDIIAGQADWWGHSFEVFDTGGVTEEKVEIFQMVKEKVINEIKKVDLVVLIMDAKSGLVPEDKDIYKIVKASGKPFVLVINKVDQFHKVDLTVSEFYKFGEDLIPASFEQLIGVDEIVEWVNSHEVDEIKEKVNNPRIVIVGKPNVGKSSLCNYLLGQNKMLVSPIAGTTMDAVKHEFRFLDKDYFLVDTGGLRKSSSRNKTNDDLEKLSYIKSSQAIEKADIVLLMIEAEQGPTDQDKKIAEHIMNNFKPFIVVSNKCDLASVKNKNYKVEFKEKIEREFHFLPGVCVSYISAKTGLGIKNLFKEIDNVHNLLRIKISTSKLNDFFYKVIRLAPAPMYKDKTVKFYYLTQTKQKPPSFICFANHPKGVTTNYRRFLTKNIQKQWGLRGLPIRLFIMKGK